MTTPRKAPIYRRIRVPAPAAGAEVTKQPDGAGLWVVRSVLVPLVTSAAVANRAVALTVADGEGVYLRTPAGTVQAATLTRNYCAYPGSSGAVATGVTVPIAWPTNGIVLPQGHTLSTATDAIDVADAYGIMVLEVTEYPQWMADRFTPGPPEYDYEP